MFFFLFKQKTAYEMRISDWSSDVCSSDLAKAGQGNDLAHADRGLMDRPQSDCAHVHETSAHRVDIARQLHAEDGWHCEDVLVGMRGEDEVARFEAGPFACSLHPAYDLVKIGRAHV